MKNKYFTLSELEQGKKGVIALLKTKGTLKRRLMDVGFIEGADISCVLASPLGDPKAYWVRGSLIALRKEDSDKILIRNIR